MKIIHLAEALLPEGIAGEVRLTIADGAIAAVEPAAPRDGAAVFVAGLTLPGLPNLHSHAFQRGMAGLSERRGSTDDSFWTWREVMYRFLDRLTPDDVLAIAAQAYVEMLEGGFTAVAEFHYLHHDIDGKPYADIAAMAKAIAEAGRETGVGLTLLPVFYRFGGFGAAAPSPGQRRFLCDRDGFAKLLEASRVAIAHLDDAQWGVAPHSLRALSLDDLSACAALAGDRPIHIHVAEQQREVEDCLAATGKRPVELLLGSGAVDARWCLVHATHLSAQERDGVAKSGAVAGLCPITEASLGDGVFDGVNFRDAGGRFGVGSDSNIEIGAGPELRMLEYSQRLRDRRRARLASPGRSVGRALYEEALAGGAQACGRRIGAIAVGRRADLVTLDENHPALAGRSGEAALDSAIFASSRTPVREVRIGGAPVVKDGRHVAHDYVAKRFGETMRRVMAT